MASPVNLFEVEHILGYKFKSKRLLQKALTHSSYSNEHNVESNERLEFLGDAVIEFIITEILYKEFSGQEGELSKIRALIVSEKPLAEIIDNLGLANYLIRGIGESKNATGSKAIKCDMFEAIVGAIYLDGGLENAKKFFIKAAGENIENIKLHGYVEDSKSKLQESLKQANILYSTIKSGADHMPIYNTTVFINGVNSGTGQGTNKKMAEENAASEALNNLKKV